MNDVILHFLNAIRATGLQPPHGIEAGKSDDEIRALVVKLEAARKIAA